MVDARGLFNEWDHLAGCALGVRMTSLIAERSEVREVHPQAEITVSRTFTRSRAAMADRVGARTWTGEL